MLLPFAGFLALPPTGTGLLVKLATILVQGMVKHLTEGLQLYATSKVKVREPSYDGLIITLALYLDAINRRIRTPRET